MKLLLTSAGITNQTIEKAFLDIVEKPVGEIRLAFVSTAANVEEGNKVEWLLRQYDDLNRAGVNWIDVIDFAAANVDWQARMDECDVLYFTGGNTFYLVDQMRKRGVGHYLKTALNTKVYVGGSASSIAMTSYIGVANMPPGDPNLPGLTDLSGFGFVDFEIEPHCDESRFEVVHKYAKTRPNGVYALDDQSAVLVTKEKVMVVSEGRWEYFEGKGGT